MKKFLSILVLFSMTLHCLSRLEVISYWYTHRHDLAYSIGLTPERVVALCKGDYFQRTHLNQQKETGEQSAAFLVQAQEIVLGSPPSILETPPVPVFTMGSTPTAYVVRVCRPATQKIFHPPLV